MTQEKLFAVAYGSTPFLFRTPLDSQSYANGGKMITEHVDLTSENLLGL